MLTVAHFLLFLLQAAKQQPTIIFILYFFNQVKYLIDRMDKEMDIQRVRTVSLASRNILK
jgi:hypothetical protein